MLTRTSIIHILKFVEVILNGYRYNNIYLLLIGCFSMKLKRIGNKNCITAN